MSQRKLIGVVAVGSLLASLLVWGLVTTRAKGPNGNPPCDYSSLWGGPGGMIGRGGMMGSGGVLAENIPEDCLQSGWFGMGLTGGVLGQMGMGSIMMGMMTGNFAQYGQFGPGSGMMGAWTPPQDLRPTGKTLTLDEAVKVAEAYIADWHTAHPLELSEVMQFSNHFYGEAVESDTGRGAFEFLFDPTTGTVIGEPGPNMMWNLRYGMSVMMDVGLWQPPTADEGDMPVTAQQAQQYAQAYLDDVLPGAQADSEAEAFYGYYTLHILRDGQIIGMLSVNGYSGQVWLHHWHGNFVTMTGHD
jgi:hypothetical protein